MNATDERIRVLRLASQPVVALGAHRLRPSGMQEIKAPQFPDWFHLNDIQRHFQLVDDGAEVVITTVTYQTTVADILALERLGRRLPIVAIYVIDDLLEPRRGGWNRTVEWEQTLIRFATSVDLLAGPQLPTEFSSQAHLPLPYGPLIGFARQPKSHSTAHLSADIYFSGAWTPPNGPPPADTRDRAFRGYIVSVLQHNSANLKLDLGKVHYWRTNPLRPGQPLAEIVNKPALLRAHSRRIDAARISLAPAGHAHYTARHSDILARGSVLLSPPIHESVIVPRPEMWARGDIGLIYRTAEDCVSEVLRRALDPGESLDAIARNAWTYAQTYLRPSRQVTQLASRVRGLLELR